MTEEDTHTDDPTPGDDTGVGPDSRSTAGTPRWVKVFGIIVILLVLLIGVLHITGNSLGGPGSHTPPIERGVQQP